MQVFQVRDATQTVVLLCIKPLHMCIAEFVVHFLATDLIFHHEIVLAFVVQSAGCGDSQEIHADFS